MLNFSAFSELNLKQGFNIFFKMITQPFINGYQMTHLQDSADRGGISRPPTPKESE